MDAGFGLLSRTGSSGSHETSDIIITPHNKQTLPYSSSWSTAAVLVRRAMLSSEFTVVVQHIIVRLHAPVDRTTRSLLGLRVTRGSEREAGWLSCARILATTFCW